MLVRAVADRQARSYSAHRCAAEVDAPGAGGICARCIARRIVDREDVSEDARVPELGGGVDAFMEELEVD